ncbi:MAG: CAP domain-containing protein, partial [Butyrivibrio sp.]|nr:CAP domain-containing protein [Butyrivibrio sp.]
KSVAADSGRYTIVVEDVMKPGTESANESPKIVDEVIKTETEDAADKEQKAEETADKTTADADEDDEEETEETEETEEAADETEAATEAAKEASQPETEAPAPVEVETPAPTQAPVEAPAPTEAAAQAPTEAPVQQAASALTSVVYKDAYNNESKYNTIEEAKAAVKVATLTDAEARAAAQANKTTYAAFAQETLNRINEYRAANGLGALTYSDKAASAAMHRAAENAYADWNMTAMENGSKRHIRPNFERASTIADEYGISGNFGENFGRIFNTPAEIIAAWQGSSSHNALLLSANYTQVGIGVAQDSFGDYYWVAIFN